MILTVMRSVLMCCTSSASPFQQNWLQKMREIVVLCYSHNACVYLLRYCNDLALYQHTSLRFINNYNSTTSLYERSTNKLLVTFRNENMVGCPGILRNTVASCEDINTRPRSPAYTPAAIRS